ncbi:glycoside hydrolase family 24 [Gloeothece citriformis PCC 7424]|uniref:Glycoside hydrolase family 24 n=1 Tax=Gloeothece citriformis (strain PCC 7424) TaxID=65393 RepID=B7KAY2_GLOC7|nr:glycoside hydrolase family protein [Gloeothece citriformis]ACK70092.1 glycoside hydrolase family 24 [Gloeothece citriformis PCC 7424]
MSRSARSRTRKKINPLKLLRLVSLSVIAILLLNEFREQIQRRSPLVPFFNGYEPQPLVMTGGDPYIRALMRTITASESNVERPYNVLYGGKYVSDLSKHPQQCVPIVTGPNVGNCTTAAGRYQFLNTTWYEKAEKYHPSPSGLLWWKSYSFEPEYQDRVIYAWLKDPQAWGVNISQLLKEGKVEEVLRLLSGTWTSLGYGIETNSMSPHLPKIYEKMLRQELGHHIS